MSDRPGDTQHVWQTTRHTTCLTDHETHNMSHRSGDSTVYIYTHRPPSMSRAVWCNRGLYVHTDSRSTVQRYTAEGAGRYHHANSKTSLRLGADHIAPLPRWCWTAGKLILQQCTYVIKCTTLRQSLTLKYKDRKGSELHLKTGDCGVKVRHLKQVTWEVEHLKTCDCGCYKHLKRVVYGVKHLKQVTLGVGHLKTGECGVNLSKRWLWS